MHFLPNKWCISGLKASLPSKFERIINGDLLPSRDPPENIGHLGFKLHLVNGTCFEICKRQDLFLPISPPLMSRQELLFLPIRFLSSQSRNTSFLLLVPFPSKYPLWKLPLLQFPWLANRAHYGCLKISIDLTNFSEIFENRFRYLIFGAVLSINNRTSLINIQRIQGIRIDCWIKLLPKL